MNFTVLVDTGLWITLFDPERNIRTIKEAERIADDIEDVNILLPFPTFYEFVNSRLSRRAARLQFEQLLQKPNVIQISDEKYKHQALENFILNARKEVTDISLVDEVIKLMLEDPNLKIDYIASFDKGLVNAALALGVKPI